MTQVSVVVFFKVRDNKGMEKAQHAMGMFELSRFEKYGDSPQEGGHLQFGNSPVSSLLRVTRVNCSGKNMIVETVPHEKYADDNSSYPFLRQKTQPFFMNALRILGFTVSV